VLILEAKKLTNLGKHIEIFHMDKIRFDEFGIPHPTKEELLHVEEVGYNWSPDLKVRQPVRYTIYVMVMPAFIQRMQAYAREAGARILENAEVQGVILENGRLAGVTGKQGAADFEARGRLVVDASGPEWVCEAQIQTWCRQTILGQFIYCHGVQPPSVASTT
jgi:flavin-dependent dehydrogenase